MVTSRSLGGGFLADAPGLGKTVEFLAFLVVERQLSFLRAEVSNSASKGSSRRHPGLTADENHLNNGMHEAQDICPSMRRRPGWIKCPCMKSSPASRFEAIPGVRIAIVPEPLMTNWRKEWYEHVDVKSKELGMRLLIAHKGSVGNATTEEKGDHALNINILKATFSKGEIPDKAKPNQEKFFVLTTVLGYQTWINNFAYQNKSGLRNSLRLKRGDDGKRYQIEFGIACADECHEKYRVGDGTGVTLVKLPGRKVGHL